MKQMLAKLIMPFTCLLNIPEHWTKLTNFIKMVMFRTSNITQCVLFLTTASRVLPSMRKDQVYHVVIVMNESTARVITACCACPAGLSGCCNHVTATLYCLEDYIHSGLKKDELKGCTERLQVWNQPRNRHVEARFTDDVNLTKSAVRIIKEI